MPKRFRGTHLPDDPKKGYDKQFSQKFFIDPSPDSMRNRISGTQVDLQVKITCLG
jgi:hypothetical protein